MHFERNLYLKEKLYSMIKLDKVMQDFEMATAQLKETGTCITIFGSARTQPSHRHYQDTVAMAKGLAEAGFGIITGGGGGIMEAGNKGAFLGKGTSVGLSIYLPFETCANDYVDNPVGFNYFFARKVIFVNYSAAFIIAPGGVGTLDEFFEIFTLMQTGKIKKRPIVLYDATYWGALLQQLDEMKGYTISAEDMDLVEIIDDPQEVVKYLIAHTTAK